MKILYFTSDELYDIPNESVHSNKRILGCSSIKYSLPNGWSQWVENGVMYVAPTVLSCKPHDYKNSTGVCVCGCRMSSSNSSGCVDPFGDCPAGTDYDIRVSPKSKVENNVITLLEEALIMLKKHDGCSRYGVTESVLIHKIDSFLKNR